MSARWHFGAEVAFRLWLGVLETSDLERGEESTNELEAYLLRLLNRLGRRALSKFVKQLNWLVMNFHNKNRKAFSRLLAGLFEKNLE